MLHELLTFTLVFAAVWRNQPKDTGDEVVGGWIDIGFRGDAVPGSSLFIGETDLHQL